MSVPFISAFLATVSVAFSAAETPPDLRDFRTVSTAKTAVIDPTERQSLILSPIEGSEFFLLENRRQGDFDTGLPAGGLLVWRFVGDHPILEESHGSEGPLGPRVFLNATTFPRAGNHAFTPDTHPSSRSLLGGGLHVHISQIRQLADWRIPFTVGHGFQ